MVAWSIREHVPAAENALAAHRELLVGKDANDGGCDIRGGTFGAWYVKAVGGGRLIYGEG